MGVIAKVKEPKNVTTPMSVSLFTVKGQFLGD